MKPCEAYIAIPTGEGQGKNASSDMVILFTGGPAPIIYEIIPLFTRSCKLIIIKFYLGFVVSSVR